MPHAVRVTAVLCAAALAATACSGSSSKPSSKSTNVPNKPVATDGTFVIAGGEFVSFDPYKDFNAAFYAPVAYDSLVNVLPSGKIVTGLAKSWTASSSTATFTLNQDITCKDGGALTPTGVAASINAAKDPKNNFGPPQQILPTVPFTVTGDDSAGTVTVTMSKAFSFITRSIGILPIICPNGLHNLKSLDHATDGTGPYQLSSYATGGPYTFTRVSNYRWGPDGAATSAPGMPLHVVFKNIPGTTSTANLLLTGGVNAAIVNGADIKRLQAAGLYKFDISTVLGLTSFNQRPGRLTDDPAVRRALVQAIDRTQTAKVALGGSGTVQLAGDIKAAGTACYTDIAGPALPPFDVNAAEQDLDNAGWKLGPGGIRQKNGKKLSLLAITDPGQADTLPATAEFMAQQWKAVGIDVSVKETPGNALVTRLYQTGDWDIFVNATPNEPLPSQLVPFVDGTPPPKGVNFAGIHNTDYERLANQAIGIAGDASCPTWQQATAALFKDADVLVVANGGTPFFGYKSSFQLGNNFNLLPTTIRMYK
jgi:peptide/nickel transport system substrate-binding protein